MNKLKKQVKGITLLALVVTIIVLLILAAVATRLALGDGGVIDEARTVANEWDKATEKEQSDLAKVAQEMRQARNGIYNGTSGNQTGDGDVAGAKDTIEKITGNETENTETTDKNGNKIVVPAGFKVVNPTDDVTAGIIIEDVSANDDYSKGNQYVWIPVSHVNGEKTNTIKDSNGVERTIELARYIFNTDGTVKTKNN